MRAITERIEIDDVASVLWRNSHERGSATPFVARHLRANWRVFRGWSDREKQERCVLYYHLGTEFHIGACKNEFANGVSSAFVMLSYHGGILLGQHVDGTSVRYEWQSNG